MIAGARRPGRTSNPACPRHPKVPMSEQTMARLRQLAEQASTPERKVSPIQVAAHLLEEAVGRSTDAQGKGEGPER
jgi:hypothetical protein